MRLFGLYALIAVAAAGYSGYWFYLADQAEAAIDAETAAWRADGLNVSYDTRRVHGYPYRLSSEFTGFTLDHDEAWRWRGERLTIHGQPWNLRHYIALLDGTSHVEWESPVGILAFDAVAESARGSLVLDDRYRANQASIELRAVRIQPVDDDDASTAALIEIHARRPEADKDGLDAALLVEELIMPDGSGGALGHEIGEISFDGSARGRLPVRLDPASLAAWRDRGGVIDTRRLVLDWGPVRVETDGTLTLDDALRPQGAFTARIVGHEVLIDLLRTENTISKDVAKVLRFTFALLSVRPDDGGPAVLTVPITIQDGWLSAGPVPVLQVRTIAAKP